MHLPILFFLLLFFSTFIFSQPGPRHLEEVAYDKLRDRLMLFGGSEMIAGGWKESSALYEWDGRAWKKFEVSGPIGRRGPGWVYDEYMKEALLIGGVANGKTVEDSVLFDVWSWNGISWKKFKTTCPVKEPEAVYDPVNKRVLVYGDANNKSSINYNIKGAYELWQFQSGKWKKLSTEGPDIVGSRMIAFDSKRNRLVIPIFSEKELTVWEWVSNRWEKSFCKNACPVYRTRFAFYYHPAEKQTFLFGGFSETREQLGDFWKWDGATWQPIEIKVGPSVRNSAHFAYGNNQLLLYGGSVPKVAPLKGIELCNELWSWQNDNWKILK